MSISIHVLRSLLPTAFFSWLMALVLAELIDRASSWLTAIRVAHQLSAERMEAPTIAVLP